MALNRLKPGTPCTVRNTGESGIIKQIYFYPTKYEIEFPDGRILHLYSKDLEIDGVQQNPVLRKVAAVPDDGIGESWSTWSPFEYESEVIHHHNTTKKIMWDMLTSLELYNIWFFGIQRTLPINEIERYVHRYSFDHFEIKPGNYFKMRPKTIAPWFRCRILTVEKEQTFGFTFQTNPMVEEYVEFNIKESESGIWLKCRRQAKGFFSILCEFNWEEKSKVLQNLDSLIPKVLTVETEATGTLDGAPQASQASGDQITDSLSKDDIVAYLVNKGMDGDMDAINNHPDKVTRAKAKAMIVKIKRGSIEKPKMPDISASKSSTNLGKENSGSQKTDEMIFEELLAKGLNNEMDEINALDNTALRGKIKAAIIKAKRSKK